MSPRLTRTQFWSLASAAALAGSTVAVGVSASTTRSAQAPGPSLPPGLTDADFMLCHAPGRGGPAAGFYRFAATQTEDTKSARDAEAQLAKTWVGDTSLLNISRL